MPLTTERAQQLTELCRRFRIEALTGIQGVQSGHPGGSLSCCEILALLYQERMNISAQNPDDPNRDRLVLSKGHAVPMLYVNLIAKGFLPEGSMSTLRRVDSDLQGHPCSHTAWVWVLVALLTSCSGLDGGFQEIRPCLNSQKL